MSIPLRRNKYAEAAITVLLKSSKPLHFQKITERAVKKSLLERSAAKHAEKVRAALRRDIRKNGKKSVFYRPELGVFGLNPGIFKKPVVYIITIPDIADHVKIGKTTRGRMDSVLKQMHKGSVLPFSFKFFYAAEVDDSNTIVKKIKIVFKKEKIGNKPDFYRVNPEQIKAMIAIVPNCIEITPE